MQRLPVCFWTMENQDIESPESPSPLQKPSTLEQMATKGVSSTKEASNELLSLNLVGSPPPPPLMLTPLRLLQLQQQMAFQVSKQASFIRL